MVDKIDESKDCFVFSYDDEFQEACPNIYVHCRGDVNKYFQECITCYHMDDEIKVLVESKSCHVCNHSPHDCGNADWSDDYMPFCKEEFSNNFSLSL